MTSSQKTAAPRNDVHRVGYGYGPARLSLFGFISLKFWALIAMVALQRGRSAVISGDDWDSIDTLVSALPGRTVHPSAQNGTTGFGTAFDYSELPRAGYLKLIVPASFDWTSLPTLLGQLAADERTFVLATANLSPAKSPLKTYAPQRGARPLFFLELK